MGTTSAFLLEFSHMATWRHLHYSDGPSYAPPDLIPNFLELRKFISPQPRVRKKYHATIELDCIYLLFQRIFQRIFFENIRLSITRSVSGLITDQSLKLQKCARYKVLYVDHGTLASPHILWHPDLLIAS